MGKLANPLAKQERIHCAPRNKGKCACDTKTPVKPAHGFKMALNIALASIPYGAWQADHGPMALLTAIPSAF
jgi:hypothetical protein